MKTQFSSTIFQLLLSFLLRHLYSFFQKPQKLIILIWNINEGVLRPSRQCCENFKVVNQTFATVQFKIGTNFHFKTPSYDAPFSHVSILPRQRSRTLFCCCNIQNVNYRSIVFLQYSYNAIFFCKNISESIHEWVAAQHRISCIPIPSPALSNGGGMLSLLLARASISWPPADQDRACHGHLWLEKASVCLLQHITPLQSWKFFKIY
jgi:hypothetical protein